MSHWNVILIFVALYKDAHRPELPTYVFVSIECLFPFFYYAWYNISSEICKDLLGINKLQHPATFRPTYSHHWLHTDNFSFLLVEHALLVLFDVPTKLDKSRFMGAKYLEFFTHSTDFAYLLKRSSHFDSFLKWRQHIGTLLSSLRRI